MSLSRRGFLRSGASASAAFAGLPALAGCSRGALGDHLSQVEGFGPLRRDPRALFDLPEGFSYEVLSETGDVMDDGLLVPGHLDGMAAFPGPDGAVTLIRNHELYPQETDRSAFGPNAERLSRVERARIFDFTQTGAPHLGGTTTLHVDPDSLSVRRQFMSLAGTCNNCAGGPTPWGSWISCEETLLTAGDRANYDHGYPFEVPADAEGLVEPVPLRGLGRFRHEAVGVDPASGIVYQTEDDNPGLIHRFIPDRPGELWRGGRLQALAVRGRPGADLRNWESGGERTRVGEPLLTEWIDLEDIHSPEGDLAVRGVDAGAAAFTRGEGMWFGEGEVYFCCTDGGPDRLGQIWRYRPSRFEGYDQERAEPGVLELFVESRDARLLEACDNITIAPWGDLIVVEDGSGDQYMRGVTPEGRLYTIGRNAANDIGDKSEITGPCFSPDGTTLFFNIYSRPGRTFAVRGPWGRRSLSPRSA